MKAVYVVEGDRRAGGEAGRGSTSGKVRREASTLKTLQHRAAIVADVRNEGTLKLSMK